MCTTDFVTIISLFSPLFSFPSSSYLPSPSPPPPPPCSQMVHHSKKHGFVTLYITATDSAECGDWVSTLRQGQPTIPCAVALLISGCE